MQLRTKIFFMFANFGGIGDENFLGSVFFSILLFHHSFQLQCSVFIQENTFFEQKDRPFIGFSGIFDFFRIFFSKNDVLLFGSFLMF